MTLYGFYHRLQALQGPKPEKPKFHLPWTVWFKDSGATTKKVKKFDHQPEYKKLKDSPVIASQTSEAEIQGKYSLLLENCNMGTERVLRMPGARP